MRFIGCEDKRKGNGISTKKPQYMGLLLYNFSDYCIPSFFLKSAGMAFLFTMMLVVLYRK